MSQKIYKDTVKVAGVNYSVLEIPFVEIGGDKNFAGSCSYTECEISILDSLSNERKNQVFVHELAHAIFNEAGYDEHDEEMINRIGIVLHQVIADNYSRKPE